MERRSQTSWFLVGLLVLLALFSLYLSQNRIYQVDEAQNIFMARIIGTGQTGAYFTHAPLWLTGPLAWLAEAASHSVDLFGRARLVFLGVFWINLFLLALCTGGNLRSSRGLFALLMATTLAPLWDYGFEIRHDNLILTGLLLTWWTCRTKPQGMPSYLLTGFIAALMPFVAFKAFAYFLPLSLALLLLPPPGHNRPRLPLFLAWIAGAGIALLLCRLAYGLSGLWPVFTSGLGGGFEASATGVRFGPWISLRRPLEQTPLLLAGVAAALAGLGRSLYHKDWKAFDWSGHAPEGLLFLGALGVLFVNPTPFPYNLVNLIPFAFLLAFRFLEPLLEQLPKRPALPFLAAGVLLFSHLVPFATATWRHVDWKNDRQEFLMRTAESLTDPSKDPVYDAIGMVPTRSSIHFHWYLHSLNVESFRNGKVPSVTQMLQARPAAVFIPSYRTEWISKSDWDFIQSRYVPLADDFWVLGQVLPPGGGRFTLVHPGRYQILGKREGHVLSLQAGFMDGHSAEGAILELGMGTHELKCSPDTQPACLWVGPKVNQLPELPPSDHLRLFVNWY